MTCLRRSNYSNCDFMMEASEFYRLVGPKSWTLGPKSFSHSSLNTIERCPLQWQLAYSEYAGLGKYPARPSPATVEGNVVHEVLDQLFKLLSVNGLPELGTDEFQSCVMLFNIRESVQTLIDKHETDISRHPRSSGFKIKFSAQQLSNKIIRLFREAYHQAFTHYQVASKPSGTAKSTRAFPSSLNLPKLLKKYRALSELSLTHPTLNFVGIIDLVRLDNDDVVIVDFKTGKEKPEHATQLLYYAILWWRCSGILPNLLEIRYPGKLVDLKVSEKQLLDAEGELSSRIGALETNLSVAPSKECLGSHCRYCDVRQFCNKYWCQGTGSLKGKKNKHTEDEGIGDLEVVIAGEPSNFGFEAVTNTNQKLSITYENNTGQIHGPFENGERLRIIRGVMDSSPLSVELKPWSEVFHLGMGFDG
jgi:hypothetical protein